MVGNCNLDHSQSDVMEKLQSQKGFLPEAITEKAEAFLKQTQTQSNLNELFHLLKKYDLATEDEQQERNKKLIALIS